MDLYKNKVNTLKTHFSLAEGLEKKASLLLYYKYWICAKSHMRVGLNPLLRFPLFPVLYIISNLRYSPPR